MLANKRGMAVKTGKRQTLRKIHRRRVEARSLVGGYLSTRSVVTWALVRWRHPSWQYGSSRRTANALRRGGPPACLPRQPMKYPGDLFCRSCLEFGILRFYAVCSAPSAYSSRAAPCARQPVAGNAVCNSSKDRQVPSPPAVSRAGFFYRCTNESGFHETGRLDPGRRSR